MPATQLNLRTQVLGIEIDEKFSWGLILTDTAFCNVPLKAKVCKMNNFEFSEKHNIMASLETG